MKTICLLFVCFFLTGCMLQGQWYQVRTIPEDKFILACTKIPAIATVLRNDSEYLIMKCSSYDNKTSSVIYYNRLDNTIKIEE